MTEIAIRAAERSDLPAIDALERAAFASDRLSRRSLRAFVAAPHRPLLVATEGQKLLGYALLALRKGARTARLYSIAVDAEAARRGIGRALLNACEAYAAAQGRRALRLEVRADNRPAIALYERLGYIKFGHYDSYYADGATALRFEKPLTGATPGR